MKDLSVVRVLVYDDDAQWRQSVTSRLLEMSAQVVGTAIDGFEAIYKARALQPDVVLMEVWTPKLNAVAATRQIHRVSPESRILIVTHEADPRLVQTAIEAGARGYILKAFAAIELAPAIEALYRGEMFVGRGLQAGDSNNPTGAA